MKGSCLCGAIRYQVDRLDSDIQHCACRTCQKSHAAAYNSSAKVRLEHFHWLSGEELLGAYESSPGKTRYFCSRCGSQLIARRTGVDAVNLRVATLDEDPGVRPNRLIWNTDASPWLECRADLDRRERE